MARRETWLKFGKESESFYAEINKKAFGNPGLDSVNLFMMAMSYGFAKGRRTEEFQRAQNGPRTALKGEHFALMTALQIATDGDSTDIMDLERRDRLAEEYAEGGIRLLFEKMSDPTVNFSSWLALEVAESLGL